MKNNISFIILTRNEEVNIKYAIESVFSWADVFVVDSGSNDKTEEIVKSFKDVYFLKHEFEGYSRQRNWAIKNLPIKSEWVFFLDADEYIPEKLKNEILEIISKKPEENGFFLKFKMVFMGKVLKFSPCNSTKIVRLVRFKHAEFDERGINERLIVSGKTGFLNEPFIHHDRKGLFSWIEKHNRYSDLEAERFFKDKCDYSLKEAFKDNGKFKHYIRIKIWNRLPLGFRPFMFFIKTYFFDLTFLEGLTGFAYSVLWGFLYMFLIDVKIIENKLRGHHTKLLTINEK